MKHGHLSHHRARAPHEPGSTEWYLSVAIVAMGLMVVAWLAFTANKVGAPATSPDAPVGGHPQPSVVPIAQGRQIYSITNKGPGPLITPAVIDPFDPKKGEVQTFEIAASHDQPINEISVVLRTDNGETTYPLTLVSGSETNGQWKGSWTTNDTHDHIYTALVVASSDHKTTVTLSFR